MSIEHTEFAERLKPQKEYEANNTEEIAKQVTMLLDEARKHPDYEEVWTEDNLKKALTLASVIHPKMNAHEVLANLRVVDDKYVGKFTSLEFHIKGVTPSKYEGSIPHQLDYDMISLELEGQETIATVSNVYFGSDEDISPRKVNSSGESFDLCPPQKIYPLE